MGRVGMAKHANHKLYKFHLEVASMDGAVDAEAGVVEGVSVITSGVQAKGHNLEVDDTTLEQMLNLAQARPGGKVPTKWNHKTGADAVNGFFTNFRRIGNKLKADWHLLKTHSQYEQALELAERMPENVGFSASFMGLSELADGRKVYNPDEKTKTHYTIEAGKRVPVKATEKIFARCEELISVDLVATPAANPDGMFSAGDVDSPSEDMAENTTPGKAPDDKDASNILLAEFRQFAEGMNKRITYLEELVSAEEEDDDDDYADDDDGDEGEDGEGAEQEFKTPADVVRYFEQRLDRAAAQNERKEFEAAYNELEAKVTELASANQQLAGENEILAKAYKELSAKTKTVVQFSAGADGERRVVVKKAADGKELTAFEARVEELKATGKTYSEALTFAVDEDTERYAQHLQAKGAVTHL